MHFLGRLMTKEHLVVKIVAGYVVISFIVIEVLFLGVWCRPISHYWELEAEDCMLQFLWEVDKRIDD